MSKREHKREELFQHRVSAIRKCIELGRTLQKDYPEIADLYRNGMFQGEISDQLGTASHYGVSQKVAKNAVGYAITGSGEMWDLKPYGGLISEEERKNIAKQHKQRNNQILYEQHKGAHGRTLEQRIAHGHKGGTNAFAQNKGIHGRSLEQMRADGIKGGRSSYEQGKGIHAQTPEERKKIGLIGGEKVYKEGKGIHARTPEQMTKHGQMGGLKATISKGQVPWEDEEKQFVYGLSQNPDYQRGIRTDLEKINKEVNDRWHDGRKIRTNNAISIVIRRIKISLLEQDRS